MNGIFEVTRTYVAPTLAFYCKKEGPLILSTCSVAPSLTTGHVTALLNDPLLPVFLNIKLVQLL